MERCCEGPARREESHDAGGCLRIIRSRLMRSKPRVAALVVLGLSGLALEAVAGETAAKGSGSGQWTPLFNGRDLAGWYTFVGGKKGEDAQNGSRGQTKNNKHPILASHPRRHRADVRVRPRLL